MINICKLIYHQLSFQLIREKLTIFYQCQLFFAIQFKRIHNKMQSKIFESITIKQKKHYGCFAKIFCCKCIYCCQDFDFSLLTSVNRKQAFQKMIKRYIKYLHEIKKTNVIMDPFFILVALFLGQQNESYAELMNIINNHSQKTIFSKEDLQFYIPELCTYLVFHQDLKNVELLNLMLRACKVDIHFSLKYYFYMKSLQFMNIGKEQIRKYESVSNYNKQFLNTMSNYYKNCKQQKNIIFLKNKQQINSKNNEKIQYNDTNKQNIIPDISTSIIIKQLKQDNLKFQQINLKRQKILQQNILKTYQPFIYQSSNKAQGLFQSTIHFFMDLIRLSQLLVHTNNRKQQLMKQLKQVNKRFPAVVYIPFTKDQYQDLNVVNIVFSQCKVFNTKERAPYYICMESFYNPTYNEKISKDKKIRSFSHIKKRQKKKKQYIEEDYQSDYCSEYEDSQESKSSLECIDIDKNKLQKRHKDKSEIINWSSFFKLSKKIKKKFLSQIIQMNEGQKATQITLQNLQQSTSDKVVQQQWLKQIFGQSQKEQYEKIRKQSVYSHLPGYKLIHIMIKSNDDLRQQSFAMQLLQEFDKIFKLQNLPLKLLPYEVLPLSHSAGIMQFVQDAVTIDELRKKRKSISQILNNKVKIKNFIYSLAAYSLITYLLQVKDRHNGNIMIKSDGCIFHIDYGFFISNLPGKGVEIQKNLPFKLTNQYVEALGGVKSKYFHDYRKLFFQAFSACKRHQHKILILTRLMYTSFGKGMPCFQKGNEALQQLQDRFNPKGVSNDAQLSVFCQNLINSSIDNWRSRWYDKWQYYVQGILY